MEPIPFMTFKNPQGEEMLRKATPDEIINYEVEKRMNAPSKKNVGGRKKSRKVRTNKLKRNRKQNTRRRLNKRKQSTKRRLNKRKQSSKRKQYKH